MRSAYRLTMFAVATTMLVGPARARADMVLLNNLDQPAKTTAPSPFVGQSFISGISEILHGAEMQLNPGAPPTSQIRLEVEARKADGTVGQTLFSDFSHSYNATTGLVTFTVNSQFTFQGGTGYWLVLSDPSKSNVNWDFTSSQIYQSNYGYGLPSYNTSYYSNLDNGFGNPVYYQPATGPQMFDLIASPALVPEPSSWFLLGLGVIIAGWTIHHRNRSLARLTRPGVEDSLKPNDPHLA